MLGILLLGPERIVYQPRRVWLKSIAWTDASAKTRARMGCGPLPRRITSDRLDGSFTTSPTGRLVKPAPPILVGTLGAQSA